MNDALSECGDGGGVVPSSCSTEPSGVTGGVIVSVVGGVFIRGAGNGITRGESVKKDAVLLFIVPSPDGTLHRPNGGSSVRADVFPERGVGAADRTAGVFGGERVAGVLNESLSLSFCLADMILFGCCVIFADSCD